MATPKISVIIPVYNVEKYLAKCLDSVVNQTLREIEIVCINDGSTDGSRTILQEYADREPRIKVIDQPNGGLSAARNTGLENSSAPLIMFCDSDDSYDPTMCEKMFRGIEDSGADIAMCGTQVVYEPGIKKEDDTYFEIKFAGLCPMSDDIRRKMDHCAWNKIYRRDFLDLNDIRFPNGLVNEDLYFVNACTAIAKNIFFINDYLYKYLRRHDSIMGEILACKKGKHLNLLKVTIAFYDFLKRRGILEKDREYMGWMFFTYLNTALGRESDPACRDAIYDLANDFIAREGWTPDKFSAPIAEQFVVLQKQSKSVATLHNQPVETPAMVTPQKRVSQKIWREIKRPFKKIWREIKRPFR